MRGSAAAPRSPSALLCRALAALLGGASAWLGSARAVSAPTAAAAAEGAQQAACAAGVATMATKAAPFAPHPALYFRQLLAGREVATQADAARQPSRAQVYQVAKGMQNFMYAVGDRRTGECVIIDACWHPEGVVRRCEEDGFKVVAALATHMHFDHIGGSAGRFLPGVTVPGLRELVEDLGLPAHVPRAEVDLAARQCGMAPSKLSPLEDGQLFRVGGFALRAVATPGHSPGSTCLVVESGEGEGARSHALVSGDTIFPGSCGRLDLPGSDKDAMWHSLQIKLAGLPDELRVWPGHAYNGDNSTVGRERRAGMLRKVSKEQWDVMMG